jgi:hypothetical protein
MNNPQEPGLFLSLHELKVLFSELIAFEDDLSPDAEALLFKVEKVLWDYLTIEEIDALRE